MRSHAGLTLDATKLIKRVHKEAVTWLDLDRVEHRRARGTEGAGAP